MTLRLQFDDLVHKMNDMELLEGFEDESFVESVHRGIALKEKYDKKKKELKNLKKALSKRKKELDELKSKSKTECSKLKEEKKKTRKLKEQGISLETVLEDVRNVISGHNTTKADVWSLIESANNSLSLSNS